MEQFEHLEETTLHSEAKYDGDLLHIRRDTVQLPNGKTSTREYTIHLGAVCILPLLGNGDVLLERQYRYPLRQVMTEIPAGKLDTADEDPLEAAKRELREEHVDLFRRIRAHRAKKPQIAPFLRRRAGLLAQGLSFGERELDEDEFLNVFRLPLETLVEQVLAGQIPDAKTQAAALRGWLMRERGLL